MAAPTLTSLHATAPDPRIPGPNVVFINLTAMAGVPYVPVGDRLNLSGLRDNRATLGGLLRCAADHHGRPPYLLTWAHAIRRR